MKSCLCCWLPRGVYYRTQEKLREPVKLINDEHRYFLGGGQWYKQSSLGEDGDSLTHKQKSKTNEMVKKGCRCKVKAQERERNFT